MNTTLLRASCLILLLAGYGAQAALTLDPMTSFGGGDGWLAPGEGGYAYLGTANNERGLAYGNGHLYLVSRSGASNIRRLDPLTGADLGAPLNVAGISGGTFAVNMVSVAADGAIYVCNLANPVAAATPFRVYRWANDAAAPTLAYSSTTITAGRLGDTFDLIGSGSATRSVAGESNNSGTGTRRGYAILTTSDGLGFTGSRVAFAAAPPNAGDFRLGITFTDANHVFGTQGGTGTPLRYTTFSGTTGTLLGSAALASADEAPMDFTTIAGLSLLATINTSDSTVRVWDVTDSLHPVLLAAHNNTQGELNQTGHGTGSVVWGPVVGDTATLWAMSSNQGIQAFMVAIPEPASWAVLLAGLVAMAGLRRRR